LSAVASDAEAYQAVIVDAVQAGAASVAHHRHADLPEGMTQVQDGPAGLISIVQERRPPGFAHALHMRPLDPGRLLSTKAVVERRGRLHWLLTRYAAETLDAGESLTVREERLLVGGGLHNDPACRAAVLARAESGAGDDLSLCYDYGAVLNAVATHILLAAGGRYHAAPPPGRIAGLRDWCDAHLDAYFAALAPGRADAACRAYSRELAFVTLALDGLWRATGAEGYRTRLRQAVDLLLSLLHVAVPAGAGSPGEAAFRDAWSGMAFLDCHAAAMLALARVALHREDPRFGPALRQALAAIRLSSGTAEAGEQSAVFDSLAVRCRAPEGAAREWSEDIGSASYKLGLMLRALRALQAARAAGAIALDEHEAQRAGFLATLCLDLLRSRIRLRQDVLEMRPGPLDRPTNLEAQAWSVLALLPTDAPIARTAPGLAPVAAAAE